MQDLSVLHTHSGCIYRVPSRTLDILCFCKRCSYYTPYFYHNVVEMGVFLLNPLVSDTRSKALSVVGEVRKHFCLFERKRLDSTGIITVQIARINVAVYGRRDILRMETPPATRAVKPPPAVFQPHFYDILNHVPGLVKMVYLQMNQINNLWKGIKSPLND